MNTGGTAFMLIATQLMFAIITPALITGAFAERIKFTAFLLFTVLQWCRRSLGGLATGLFATVSVNPAGADGLFHGNPKQFFYSGRGHRGCHYLLTDTVCGNPQDSGCSDRASGQQGRGAAGAGYYPPAQLNRLFSLKQAPVIVRVPMALFQ